MKFGRDKPARQTRSSGVGCWDLLTRHSRWMRCWRLCTFLATTSSAFRLSVVPSFQRTLPQALDRRLVVVAGRGKSGGARKMPRGVKKENLPSKVCVVCDRPFTWRKKWERCWDEVTTCSKACNTQRRASKGSTSGRAEIGDDAGEEPQPMLTTDGAVAASSVDLSRKEAKKAAKAKKRLKREGNAPSDHGQKNCDMCTKGVDLLVRCQVDETKAWKMVCGRCWKDVSGGKTDGDADHPHYRYGGLWKNRHAKQAKAKGKSKSSAVARDVAVSVSDDEDPVDILGVQLELQLPDELPDEAQPVVDDLPSRITSQEPNSTMSRATTRSSPNFSKY